MNPAYGLIILLAVQTTYGWWSKNNFFKIIGQMGMFIPRTVKIDSETAIRDSAIRDVTDYSARTNAPYCDFRSEIRWDRTDCGYPESIKSWCESRGCCWDPVYKDGENWCFCPNKDVETSAGHDKLRRKRKGVHVTKTVNNNCACTGTEISNGGSGPRPFQVHCWKVATCNKKRKTKQIKCSYKGNPHGCRKYNKNNKQVQFYKELLDAIAPALCMQINLENPKCPNQTFNTAQLCSEIDYKFEYQF